MPMAKVKQLKERIGIKLFNKAFFGKTTEDGTAKKPAIENTRRCFVVSLFYCYLNIFCGSMELII